MKDFRKIEEKWQKKWEGMDLYKTKDAESDSDKKYVLVEFPYPSGLGLHVGHAFSFTGADVYARYWRMKGKEVLFPMGWDAFGLPTENYAIKTKQAPQKVTDDNTAMFKRQMKKLAFSFDWSREVNTSDPDYYRWTQWIFIQLFKKGLAYKKEMPINWCPSCKSGLANEEVIDGKCERCGAEVSRRNISQWIVKITDYADKLISGLEKTDFIPKVKKAQINWIGKTSGVIIDYPIVGNEKKKLSCYSTRPDTNFGATFIVIAPEHERVDSLITEENKEVVNKYIEEAKKKSDLERTELFKEKTGVFTGSFALNRLTNKKMPIYVSDFVVLSAGTGVVVGVPAHDERDWDFAKKYDLEILPVVKPVKGEHDFSKGPFTDIDEAEVFNSEFLNGMKALEAKEKIIDYLEGKGWGKRGNNYHLRDWIFSRQHYWGEPIPMIYCEKCARHGGQGWVPVPEEDLPVRLPEVKAYEPTNSGKSPLAEIEGFVKCKCPVCGGEAERETDTMPNWAGSDWYFLRYIDPHNDVILADMEKMKEWLPVDVYVGGDEHNTLHLLYSRFIVNFLYDIGVCPVAEPYYKRLSHGVILGDDNQRMSKTKGNVILPEVVAEKYGVDVMRMYLMFMGPFEGTMAWNEKTLMGVKRFLDKWEKYIRMSIKQMNSKTASKDEVKVIVNKTIKGVEKDIKSFGFNTAIAKQMEMLNDLRVGGEEYRAGREEIEAMIKLLAPFAPYVAEEMWASYAKASEGQGPVSVHVSGWPETEEKYLTEETMMIPVAVNGKVRGQLDVDIGELGMKEKLLAKARALPTMEKWLAGKEVVREIYVQGRMINLVLRTNEINLFSG